MVQILGSVLMLLAATAACLTILCRSAPCSLQKDWRNQILAVSSVRCTHEAGQRHVADDVFDSDCQPISY